MKTFSGDNFAIITTQVWLFALAVFYLSLSVRKNTDSNFLGIIISLPVLLNPLVWDVHHTILPHSFFLSFSLFALAFFLSAFGRAWFFNLFAFGLCIGLCVILESFGWAYLILLVIAPSLIARKNNCSVIKAFILPFIVCAILVGLETATHHGVHEGQRDKLHAPHVFVSAILMETDQQSPYAEKDPRTRIWTMIETDLAQVRSDIWQSPDFSSRIEKLKTYEQGLRDTFASRELNGAAALLIKTPNELRMDIASARIVQDPLAFFYITFDHYRALWHGDPMITYPLWAMTILCVVIGLWFWLLRARFNAMFALAFVSALAIEAQTLWIAHVGVGPADIVSVLSPLLSICFLSIILGFYIAFVSPLRND
ncbi:MAG: hypothetical protein HWE30_10010 [Methylocystaceae bacterium]|nr:hypothetical protein [Methylocystaceae bacterium]